MRKVGPYLSIASASRAIGMNYSTLAGRLRRGWSDEDALDIPVGFNRYRNSKKWSVRRERWLQNQLRAKELRSAGLTYAAIAKNLKCSVSKARDLVTRENSAFQ